jgi:hypothetical protein
MTIPRPLCQANTITNLTTSSLFSTSYYLYEKDERAKPVKRYVISASCREAEEDCGVLGFYLAYYASHLQGLSRNVGMKLLPLAA